MRIVECVPNFSEGRRMEVIDAIRRAASRVNGVTVLDTESDANHNRTVLTFVGEPNAVKEAALASCAEAIRLIDLTKHRGEHPRMGAVDVVPFVPIKETTIEECVALANEFASEYAERFGVPVFLYEAAARRPERKNLATVREGEFEGLRELIGKDHSRDPDYGPKSIHPTAGATAVGARKILIAYNINLGTTDVSIAKKIAHQVRERDGGLPSVKALGFELKDKGMVQVSMNLTDYNITSIHHAFDAVSKYAGELAVPIVESEIVGLVPMAAISEAAVLALKLKTFKDDQVIENRLLSVIGQAPITQSKDIDFSDMTLREFASSVGSKDPVLGGGSVSAYSGSLAGSLVTMVCKLIIGKKGYESVSDRASKIMLESVECSEKLQALATKDAVSYSNVDRAYSLPQDTEEAKRTRTKEIALALKVATEVPAETMELCQRIFQLASEIKEVGNKNTRSHAETAMELSKAAVKGAWANVRLNLESLNDKDYSNEMLMRLDRILKAIS